MLTSKEFAKIIGVSQSTVSRAMNDSELVPLAKRNYIKKMAAEYGFVLNSQAQSLKTHKTGTVGILFPKHFKGMTCNLGLAYLYDLVRNQLNAYNYDIMVVYESIEENGISSFEKTIKQHKVDGFIILRIDFSEKEIEVIRQYKIPCVYLLNASHIDTQSSSCISDSEYGGYLAGCFYGNFPNTQYFFINVPQAGRDAQHRYRGFVRGLNESGKTFNIDNKLDCMLSIRSAYECIIKNRNRLVNQHSAIFAYNDMIALGALNACLDIGLNIPSDVQITGMDNLPLIAELSPKLSSIHIFQEEIAATGCKLLRESIEQKSTKVTRLELKPKLVLKDTTLNLP